MTKENDFTAEIELRDDGSVAAINLPPNFFQIARLRGEPFTMEIELTKSTISLKDTNGNITDQIPLKIKEASSGE